MDTSPLKVFVAEDEYLLRTTIRERMDWDTLGYSFAGEASDGALALEAIEEILPDVVITDIEMPFLNGIDLCSHLENRFPWIRVVILTGHQEFSYARDALHYGVKEFLLKPLKKEELIEALRRIAGEIENERRRVKELEQLKESEKESRAVLRERFLYQLTTGMLFTEEIEEKFRVLEIPPRKRYFIVGIVYIQSLESTDLIGLEMVCKKILDRYPNVLRYYPEYNKIVVIVTEDSENLLEDLIYISLRSFQRILRKNLQKECFIGIGSCYEGYAGVASSFREASNIVNYYFLYEKGSIVAFEDLGKHFSGTGELSLPKQEDLELFFRHGKKEEIGDFISDYYKTCLSCSNLEPLHVFYFLIIDLLKQGDAFCFNFFGLSLQEVLEMKENTSEMLMNIKTYEDFSELLAGIFNKIISFRETQKESKHSMQIKTAKKYIKEHFGKPELSLAAIAEVTGMSPAHFSSVFRQEAGVTYIEYTTEIRIEEAKQLLCETALRSSDISYKVGYTDTHYFSYLFKKRTGMTPTEYRKTHQEVENDETG